MAIVYNAGVFFDLAKNAYERSKRDNREALVGLVLATTALEAVFNEITEDTIKPHALSAVPQIAIEVGRVLHELERKPLTVKLAKTYHLLARSSLREDEEPLHSTRVLFGVRNSIAHNRPEDWDHSAAPKPHIYIKQLSELGVLPMQDPSNPPQLLALLCNPSVARWSYNHAVFIVKFLIELFPPGPFRQGLYSEYGDHKEIP
jgi:hypothetical protein